jgi:hypothetical protein
MFGNKTDYLNTHLSTSPSVQNQSLITAEWNLNSADNIKKIGNYRYRPGNPITGTVNNYGIIANSYDETDALNAYTGATDADVVVDGGYDTSGEPASAFIQPKEKQKLLYSLEDCFKRFRPRSGINKFVYWAEDSKIPFASEYMDLRPRYYTADKDDIFKYWSSYRTEAVTASGSTTEVPRGISKTDNYIDDTAPFIVYNSQIPSNRIVIKMQTGVGSVDLSSSIGYSDPFYGDSNSAVPLEWSVQKLTSNNSWENLISFNDLAPATIGSDGYFEISYGLLIPEPYKDIFVDAGEVSSVDALPQQSVHGYAYLIKDSNLDVGKYHIWIEGLIKGSYEVFDAAFGWEEANQTINPRTPFVTNLTSPEQFTVLGETGYREFDYLNGIRVVVTKMKNAKKTFDLIELSPRLSVNLTDKTESFSVKKVLADLGSSPVPVGQLIAGTGDLSIFDYDKAFFPSNTNSIIHNFSSKNLQIKFYEIIKDVPSGTEVYDYYVPIKTMYSEGFPETDNATRAVRINLRDLFLYFESTTANQLLLSNVTLSYVLTILFDSIGFSNYRFVRNANESDPVIPYFFVGPDTSIAQVLKDLAVSTQSAMFFDESNNFIVMSKNYMMPLASERDVDNYMLGNDEGDYLANVSAIQSEIKDIYNDGKILYTNRYIQKTYGSLQQVYKLDNEKTWVYKPVLLWEVSPSELSKTQNGEAGQASAYSLSAVPLAFDLDAVDPTVNNNHELINNVIDFGEGVSWIGRYNGYFYANGEVIKYDAVEYSVPGGVGSSKITSVGVGLSQVSFLCNNSFKRGNTVNLYNDNELILANAIVIDATATTFIVENDEVSEYGNANRVTLSNSNVWITSSAEYENYFSKLTFRGKIFPTGRVRIYSEPNYETLDNPDILGRKFTRLKTGAVAKSGRAQFGTKITKHQAGVNPYWTDVNNVGGYQMEAGYLFNNGQAPATPSVISHTAAESLSLAKQSSRTGIIKNFLSSSYISEDITNSLRSVNNNAGVIQSSALVISGPNFKSTEPKPTNFVSYVHKALENRFVHFGSRLRIVGKVENPGDVTSKVQSPVGSSTYYETVGQKTIDQDLPVGGSSGGLGIMVNPQNGSGYYFEIAALTDNNVNSYTSDSPLNNVFFYKMPESGTTPTLLWAGYSTIIADDGRFTGQSRQMNQENTSVYDLSVEYKDSVSGSREFFLYINEKIIATVTDATPLKIINNIALFVRGSAKCMFENVYALSTQYSQDASSLVVPPISGSVFTDNDGISSTESFRKYALSGAVQQTYLSGISSQQPPEYNIYFEEFGTIMREAAYFNVRYDKAYPAFIAKLAPTQTPIKGYTVSGFVSSPYGAEFLIFNNTDFTLVLDDTTGNYLRINGVTFTQQTSNELTVDEFFSKKSDFSNPQFNESGITNIQAKQDYMDIKNSRMSYGKKDFSLDSPYIQTQDSANELMSWMIERIMKPRNLVGLRIFSTPTIQLGDIVTLESQTDGTQDLTNARFVVYAIDYSRSVSGPDMVLYLSEVI